MSLLSKMCCESFWSADIQLIDFYIKIRLLASKVITNINYTYKILHYFNSYNNKYKKYRYKSSIGLDGINAIGLYKDPSIILLLPVDEKHFILNITHIITYLHKIPIKCFIRSSHLFC